MKCLNKDEILDVVVAKTNSSLTGREIDILSEAIHLALPELPANGLDRESLNKCFDVFDEFEYPMVKKEPFKGKFMIPLIQRDLIVDRILTRFGRGSREWLDEEKVARFLWENTNLKTKYTGTHNDFRAVTFPEFRVVARAICQTFGKPTLSEILKMLPERKKCSLGYDEIRQCPKEDCSCIPYNEALSDVEKMLREKLG